MTREIRKSVFSPLVSYDDACRVWWVNRPASGSLSGLVFTDGSAVHPSCELCRRAGWGLVMTDGLGRFLAPFQQARDGEDLAFFYACECVHEE